MLKSIKKQRGQSYTHEQKQAIRQASKAKRTGKASRVYASLSQSIGNQYD